MYFDDVNTDVMYFVDVFIFYVCMYIRHIRMYYREILTYLVDIRYVVRYIARWTLLNAGIYFFRFFNHY